MTTTLQTYSIDRGHWEEQASLSYEKDGYFTINRIWKNKNEEVWRDFRTSEQRKIYADEITARKAFKRLINRLKKQ